MMKGMPVMSQLEEEWAWELWTSDMTPWKEQFVKLLESFDWNYVSVIHSDSEYGETGFESVKRAVAKSGKICLTEPIVLHNQVRKDTNFSECYH